MDAKQYSSLSSMSQHNPVVFTTKPHLNRTKQSKEALQRWWMFSPYWSSRLAPAESNTDLYVCVKNIPAGPAGWLSQN